MTYALSSIEPNFNLHSLFVILDTQQSSATFYPIDTSDNLLPSIIYEISLSSKLKKLSLATEAESNDIKWLKYVLLKKILSWMEQCRSHDSQPSIESHHLINSELFNDTYAQLKDKYGKKLEDGWNESTDPKKFIYEDIAIASYLIVLWKQEREKTGVTQLQSFVDLGCGNGLLVYLLSQEHHRGYGIDLRKRKIWSQFPADTDLREIAIVPSDESLFSDVDWIIGNHSDELSPWIPVISARSSFTSKYFLLPCCAFEFSGAKYQRKNGTKSQYLSFVDYLTTISETCGFVDTKIDRLKIPSTKRICLIGTKRSFDESNFKLQCDKIQAFINDSNAQQGSSEKWSESFTPREKTEAVKNCSKIDKSISESIVKMIFGKLLSIETKCNEFPGWNCGGQLTIPEAVNLVSKEDLKKLKSECGGLQTLLRNKHQIFHIFGGSIRIRLPTRLSARNFSEKSLRRNVVKSSDCYFYKNYICPLDGVECSYKHD